MTTGRRIFRVEVIDPVQAGISSSLKQAFPVPAEHLDDHRLLKKIDLQIVILKVNP